MRIGEGERESREKNLVQGEREKKKFCIGS
jgi:hypothetical protein